MEESLNSVLFEKLSDTIYYGNVRMTKFYEKGLGLLLAKLTQGTFNSEHDEGGGNCMI